MAKSRKRSDKSRKKTKLERMEGHDVPDIVLKTRVKSKKKDVFKWKDVPSRNLFKGKRIVAFSVPGAFTPTCTTTHLPSYERMYTKLKKLGVDDVYCISVNDPFVMYNWGKKLHIKKVKLIPDGNGDFTKKMGALIKKNNLGFGDRSWRYSMYVSDGKIKKIFAEPYMSDNYKKDPLSYSNVETMIDYLEHHKD